MKLGVATVLLALTAAAHASPDDEIKIATSPLPPQLRATATVVRFNAKGGHDVLRKGTGPLVCFRVEQGEAPIDARCYHQDLSGVTYTLVASGTYTAAPPAVDPMADAEYYDMTDPNGGPKDIDTTNNIDFGLAIDSPVVGMTKTPAHWGPYRSDHIYTVPFTGSGATLSAKLFDCCYTDNIGTMTLQIFESP